MSDATKLPTVKLSPGGAIVFDFANGEPDNVVDLGLRVSKEVVLNLIDCIRRALDQTFDVVASSEDTEDELTKAHDAAELALLQRLGAPDGHLYVDADAALKYAQAFAALRGAR